MKSSSKRITREVQRLESYGIEDSLKRFELKKDHLVVFSLMTGVALVYLFLQGTYALELFGSYGLNVFMTAAATVGLVTHVRLGKSQFSYVSLGFALGLISWASGLWIYTYTYYIANASLPYISVVDAFYLMSYPPMVLGAIALLRLVGGAVRRIEWVAMAGVATALIILIIAYVVLPSIEDLTDLEALVTVLYSSMDAVVFLLLLPIFFAFRKGIFGKSFALIALGAASYTLGDIVLAYVNTTSGYYDGHPLDLLLFFGCVAVGYGFWKRNSDLKLINFGESSMKVKLDLGTHCLSCNLEARDHDMCQVCQRISRKLFHTNPNRRNCPSSTL